jgi:hypothetical protein
MKYTAPPPNYGWKITDLPAREREAFEKEQMAKNFTPAVLVNNRIFAGHVDGGMYVFDVAAFAGSESARGVAASDP